MVVSKTNEERGNRQPGGVSAEIARPRASHRSLLMLGVASLGWGVSTTLSAFALRQIGPTDLLAIELVSGGLVILVAALRTVRYGTGGMRDGSRRARDGSRRARHSFATPDWRAFAVLGLCEPGLTYLLANEGLRRDSAATAALLFATEAIIVVPLAAVFLSERVSTGVFWAIGVGLVGTLVIAGGAHAGRDTLTGHMLILASSAAAAAYALLARHSTHRAPALVVTSYQLLAAASIALPYAIVSNVLGRGGPPEADLAHWGAAIAAGLAGVALPFLLYNRAIVEVRATIAAGVLNLVPLVGFLTAVIFLGDRPTLAEMVGGALILASAAWLARNETTALAT